MKKYMFTILLTVLPMQAEKSLLDDSKIGAYTVACLCGGFVLSMGITTIDNQLVSKITHNETLIQFTPIISYTTTAFCAGALYHHFIPKKIKPQSKDESLTTKKTSLLNTAEIGLYALTFLYPTILATEITIKFTKEITNPLTALFSGYLVAFCSGVVYDKFLSHISDVEE